MKTWICVVLLSTFVVFCVAQRDDGGYRDSDDENEAEHHSDDRCEGFDCSEGGAEWIRHLTPEEREDPHIQERVQEYRRMRKHCCPKPPHHDGDRCKDIDCREAEEWIKKLTPEEREDPEIRRKIEEIMHCCRRPPHHEGDRCEDFNCREMDEVIRKLAEEAKKDPMLKKRLEMLKRKWGHCCGKDEEDPKCDMEHIDCDEEEDWDKSEDDMPERAEMEEYRKYREYCCGRIEEHEGKHDANHERRHHKKVAMVAGLSSALVLVVIILLIVGWCCCRKRNYKREQTTNRTFDNLYYGETGTLPTSGYISEKKAPLPEDDMSPSTTYETIPAYTSLKPELILTAPPAYTEAQYDNPKQ